MMWAILKLSAVFLLVLANAFFVAVEFALVSVKRVRIEALAATGDGGAKAALKALDHMDSMLSACQFGITLASLVLGAVGESTIAHLLEPFIYKIQIAFGGQFPIDPKLISHTIAITLALAIITYLHLVLGEYAPKAFAIEKAEAVSIATSKWLWWFYRTFKPFIQFINISGIKLLKMFGIDFRPGHHTVYNEDELRRLINISHQSGHIESDERELIHNVFEFTDLTVDEIMIPRTEVTAIDADADYDQVLRTFRESGYSRLPVFKDNFDNIVGVLHGKDIVPVILKKSREPKWEFDINEIMRRPAFIPDSIRVGDALHILQKSNVHLAVVVDEHGGVEGILTLEDILEELVGEIQDEHDEALTSKLFRHEDGVIIIDAGISIREANRKFNLNLTESDDYTTLAGFLIARAGRLLQKGDVIEYNNSRFTIQQVARHRITVVKMEPILATGN